MSAAIALPAFCLRDEQPDDRRCVLSRWYRAEAEASAHSEGKFFATWQHQSMTRILERPTTRVIIASPEGDDAIAGFAVLDAQGTCPVVYFVHVIEDARRMGLARLLLGALWDRRDVIYTTRPARVRDSSGVWRNSPIPIPGGWRFMPRAAFFEVPT